MQSAALIFAALSAGTILFHLAIIAGAPWGHLTMGGRWPGRLPLAARLLSLLSAALVALMAFVLAAGAGIGGPTLPAWTLWAVIVYLALAIVMHIATPSAAERMLWLPVILGMTVCALVVAFL